MKRKTEPRAREADYAVVVEPMSDDDGGGWLASVPALPGRYGDGERAWEALEDALAAIDEWKDAAAGWGATFPGQGRWANGASAFPKPCTTSCAASPRRRA